MAHGPFPDFFLKPPEDATPARSSPHILIFDVNETLIDIEALVPLFVQVFGDKRVMREWFGQLVLYAMTTTLSGSYENYVSLGGGVFQMLGAIHDVFISTADVDALQQVMLTLPAHPDVAPGLQQLVHAGFRIVSLTNSPPNLFGPTSLECAGLARFFERQFSIDTVRAFKPSPIAYHTVARELGVGPSDCCMIAAHVWDTIGAQSAGLHAGLITRPGNAPLSVFSLPQPNIIAKDLSDLAAQAIKLWRA